MREIDKIIIHCSATPPSMDIGAATIDKWHKDRGWSQIGYHFVIRRDGAIEDGRDIKITGAHVAGNNTGSIGICLIGGVDKAMTAEDNFTDEQWKALRNLLRILKADFKRATIHGHNEFDSGKACPSFLVQKELTTGRLKDV